MRAKFSVALVVALLLAGVGAWWWQQSRRTPIEWAVAHAPADSQRLSWTDWAAVRAQVPGASGGLELWLTAAYDADLTSNSALIESAPILDTRFGISPAALDWELFSQSPAGAAIMLKPSEGFDWDALERRLESLGYTKPVQSDGVWEGGPDLVASIGPDLTPELSYLVVRRDEGVLVSSDTDTYAAEASHSDGATRLSAVATGEPVSAAVFDGDYACAALAMSQADEADQARASELVARAGKVNPYTGFAMSRQPDGSLRVAMSFDSQEQARVNADSRATLATGPAVGQGGDFSERFSLRSATADGTIVRLDLEPVPGQAVLGDLTSGPVLFASC